ncbi:MAG: hypothetical protein K8I03_04080 [Ignavibacteria bacterium]|nr:hypothetical protein [Ignavibacteria bacterium]
MNRVLQKYFDLYAVSGFVLLMPSTIIVISFTMRIFGIPYLFEIVKELHSSLHLFNYIYACCFVAILIGFIGIIYVNTGRKYNCCQNFPQTKSYFNLAIISFSLMYSMFIFLYLELDKFGNIPVGRD